MLLDTLAKKCKCLSYISVNDLFWSFSREHLTKHELIKLIQLQPEIDWPKSICKADRTNLNDVQNKHLKKALLGPYGFYKVCQRFNLVFFMSTNDAYKVSTDLTESVSIKIFQFIFKVVS